MSRVEEYSKANAVREYAKKAIRWRFVKGGRVEGAVDCCGLVILFYKEQGFMVPHYAWDPNIGDYTRFLKEYYTHFTPVEKTKLQPGDALLFTGFTEERQHAGIYLGFGEFLHASENHGISIERLTSDLRDNHLVLACRPRVKADVDDK